MKETPAQYGKEVWLQGKEMSIRNRKRLPLTPDGSDTFNRREQALENMYFKQHEMEKSVTALRTRSLIDLSNMLTSFLI